MKLSKPFEFGNPKSHVMRTERLARRLDKKDVYNWLLSRGYFPENYVLPPCFEVSLFHPYGKPIFGKAKKKYKPDITEICSIHFPRTALTDRTFGVMDPRIHADIAFWITSNWKTILDRIFHRDNRVCSYSFPVPLDSNNPGKVGRLRSGRMIYEFIEMAESDLSAVAYRFKYLVKTDVKNFYPSIYTHSISWAIHTKKTMRTISNRYDFSYVGNRLDKLFQNSNDGCTNGITIGPAVSDFIAELILASVDRILSKAYSDQAALVVRFKDDYRILCDNEATGNKVLKALQRSLREFNLEINDSKTEVSKLPDNLFRKWKSLYHAVNPRPRAHYGYERFKEVYLAVIEIDKTCPNTGVIDRFLADIIKNKPFRPNFRISEKRLPSIISLLLMLGRQHPKAFPKVLGILEIILRLPGGNSYESMITDHLDRLIKELSASETENTFLLVWLIYFMRSNKLASNEIKNLRAKDPFSWSTRTSRNHLYKSSTDFKLFSPVGSVSKKVTLLEHLDVFKPQEN